MKILTLGLGAFGFAINKVLGENNPEKTFYGFELNSQIVDSLKETRKHPFFFDGYKLPENIEIIKNYDDIISEVDLLIIAIPAQYIAGSIDGFKDKLKPGVTIMNLAKGIDIKTNSPISKVFAEKLLKFDYNYSVLSGGMIAAEVVEGKKLGADLGIENKNIGEKIKKLLESKNLKINVVPDILNVELYGSLKNIMAILVGYYEGKGEEKSTIGFYIVEFYNEMKELIKQYGGNSEINFSYYSLGGDIIATCFGGSRNRYFGQLLGSGKNIEEVLTQLKNENKHAEGYETLKAVYNIIENKEGFELTKWLYNLIK